MEIRELHLANAGFEVQTVEFEMLTQYFEKDRGGRTLVLYDNGTNLTRLRDICAMQLSEKRLGKRCAKPVQTSAETYQQTELFGIWVQNKAYSCILYK